ncbi:MAG: beta-N-acetylhexosaminidase [Chitinophaga sp.]|uniref:beta-N-acetylhexosaminidase n=1 Tax=Chitinophaga sp. TaxID=1869181 RepID=UPI001B17356A|nr:beta-N-acetylhexosaminidase [Chitinophaga sp.]MBO9730906.1 beta-N-acetylhexosaminidase [Chitinophaga sp.]
MNKKSKWPIWLVLFLLSGALRLQAQQVPALIPLPQSVKWNAQQFPLHKVKAIVVTDDSLRKEAALLQQMLAEKGFSTVISQQATGEYLLRLQLGKVPAPDLPEEAYHLQITGKQVTLTANQPHGIFNGLQTLYQLLTTAWLPGCDIVDYPAYKWRGYMVDAGRNYQSPALLEQQIDIMSRYKLNIFHFHLTEDVAWRLEIKKYPALTAAENMTRNKGKYYTEAEMKALIQYCKDRYITLVPEIDIPGHSSAFKRATGVDMQSEKGHDIVLDIINEVAATYDLPYLHIGADEVDITNKQLLPDVSKAIRQHHMEVITWAPGGTGASSNIRQLWKEEHLDHQNVKYIDSRFLYLSDLDPMNSVVTIFNRQIGQQTKGNTHLLGAEICLWSDRRVAKETDLLLMTPVYPAMLAFSERSWRGGGNEGVVFYIGNDTSARAKDFVAFEKRLTDHKRRYFSQLPFQYVKQSNIHWKLFGPFDNKGALNTGFWPEGAQLSLQDSAGALHVTGGTVWLWHTHGPEGPDKVKAWVPSPRENTTWYAFTRFWSAHDTTITMFTELKDLSRSGADATPPAGEWDYMKSRIWINGNLLLPPRWSVPGRESGRLEDPLVDEGFYYRPPALVKVKKGWNSLLIRLPIDQFNPGKDWQVPPKLMFTIIPVHQEKGMNWYANDMLFQPGK